MTWRFGIYTHVETTTHIYKICSGTHKNKTMFDSVSLRLCVCVWYIRKESSIIRIWAFDGILCFLLLLPLLMRAYSCMFERCEYCLALNHNSNSISTNHSLHFVHNNSILFDCCLWRWMESVFFLFQWTRANTTIYFLMFSFFAFISFSSLLIFDIRANAIHSTKSRKHILLQLYIHIRKP